MAIRIARKCIEFDSDYKRREEVSKMGRTIAQALIEEGEARGVKLGFEKGQVETTQANMLDVLNARFTVPYVTLANLNTRIQQIRDMSVLRSLLTDAVKAETLDDFFRCLDELQV